MNKTKGKELELLLAILPDNNGSLYGMAHAKILVVLIHVTRIWAWVAWIWCDCFIWFFFSGDLKRICETDLGIMSQCCLTKHVFKISKQYLANVSLKINVKVWLTIVLWNYTDELIKKKLHRWTSSYLHSILFHSSLKFMKISEYLKMCWATYVSFCKDW